MPAPRASGVAVSRGETPVVIAPLCVARISVAAINVSWTGTVASATAGHHPEFLFVTMVLVVASATTMPIASTTIVTTAWCSAATPLEHQDQIPGQLSPGKVAPVIPQEIVIEPTVVDEQVAAMPVADVGVKCGDDASTSNITTGAAGLPPPLSVYAPMEWMLAGPSAGCLIDDPDRSISLNNGTTNAER